MFGYIMFKLFHLIFSQLFWIDPQIHGFFTIQNSPYGLHYIFLQCLCNKLMILMQVWFVLTLLLWI
jgi:hypothetical protein